MESWSALAYPFGVYGAHKEVLTTSLGQTGMIPKVPVKLLPLAPIVRDQMSGRQSSRVVGVFSPPHRICFVWKDGDAKQVEVVDYH